MNRDAVKQEIFDLFARYGSGEPIHITVKLGDCFLPRFAKANDEKAAA